MAAKPHRLLDRIVQVTEAKGSQTPRGDGTRLFVGGLHPHCGQGRDCSPGDLFTHFTPFGTVANAYVILDPKNGMSRRFGYVEFADPKAASLALTQAHYILGRPVTLEVHRGKANSTNPQQAAKKPSLQEINSNNLDTQPISGTSVQDEVTILQQRIEFLLNQEYFDSSASANKQGYGERIKEYHPKLTPGFPSPGHTEQLVHKCHDGEGKIKDSEVDNSRPFNVFYKNLKRTHVQQPVCRLREEANYVYRRRKTPYLTNSAHWHLTR